jgi:hypothetical protein
MTYTKGYWQNLAQEMRGLAAETTDPNMKRTLLDIADRYERLVELAEKPDRTAEISSDRQ